MAAGASLEGRYFDGRTAVAHAVVVDVRADGLAISGETANAFWPANRLIVISRDAREIRLADRKDDSARLVLAASAAAAIAAVLPELLSGRPERRRMTALIVTMIAATSAIAAAIFFGAPAVSGPLAQATPKDLEIRMGENLAGQINLILKPCDGSEAASALLQPTLDRFAADNGVEFPIRFQIVSSTAPNAFALPGGQVMATRGLIDALEDDQEAFLAVAAHELGHVRQRDSLIAIYRNAGVGVALDIITGGSGAAQQAVILAGQVNQMRHSRRQEAGADEVAAEILLNADLDPSALARAFDAIRGAAPEDAADGPDIPTWLSSHPDTEQRIAAARSRASPRGPLPISDADWAAIAGACR